MKHWPKRSRITKAIVWHWIFIWITRVVLMLPIIKKRFSNYKDIEELCSETTHKFETTAKPDILKLYPFQVTFLDLFHTEDFARLKHGLTKIMTKYEKGMFTNLDNLNTWFSRDRLQHGGFEWHSFGYIDLKSLSQNADGARIELWQLSPSTISMSVIVTPSDSFKNRFANIIAKDAASGGIITNCNLRGYRISQLSAIEKRQDEIEDLFLNLNRDVVKLLRKTVCRGWSMGGPMPAISTFVMEDGSYSGDYAYDGFWRSMKMDNSTLGNYTREGIHLSVADPKESELAPTLRVLIDEKLLLKDVAIEQYGGKISALQQHLRDPERYYEVAFILLENSRRIAKRVSDLNNYLSPELSGKLPIVRRLWKWLWSMNKVAILNQQIFENNRLMQEIKQKHLKRILVHIQGFRRKTYFPEDKGEFLVDWQWRVRSFSKYTKVELDVLRQSYHDYINFGLQRAFIWLAIVGILLTILSCIPESFKDEAFRWIFNLPKPP